MFRYILRVVEIQTKLASVLPFLFTTTFLILNQVQLNYFDLVIFFIAMLAFDMAVTLINTIYGLKKEEVNTKDHEQLDTMISAISVNVNLNYYILAFLMIVAITLGFYLMLSSSIMFILLSILVFLIGVTYSFGPLPTCQTPLGEILSGTAMGLLLPFLIIENQTHFISLNFINLNLVKLGFVFIPLAFLIAAIMLVNNIVDLDADIKNNRRTIVYYLGKNKALFCYKLLYVGTILVICLNILLSTMPILALIIVPIILKVIKEPSNNLKKFIPVKNFLKISIWLIFINILAIYI